MEENIAEYEALRAYMLHKENEIMNETIYMYVTYFALISIGSIWNSWLSIITFLDLIVFQSMINGSELSITKASIFIRVYFESSRSDIHWETLHTDEKFRRAYDKLNHSIGWFLCKYGATILATTSYLSILWQVCSTLEWNLNDLTLVQVIQIFLALGLCLLTIYVNRLYFVTRDEKNSKSRQELTNSIKSFRAKSRIDLQGK